MRLKMPNAKLSEREKMSIARSGSEILPVAAEGWHKKKDTLKENMGAG